jgi:hypothetical protein
MAASFRRFAVLLALFSLAVGPAFAQDTSTDNGFQFKMDLGIGVQSFPEVDNTVTPPSATTTYQSLAFAPEISFGKFGIGLALVINYRFGAGGSSFSIREADWVPSTVSFESILGLYLPKIMYIRWGEQGDPLFLKFGSFNDGTLGDGFIVGDYANTLFLPAERHFGLEAGLDGVLFKFPYVGMQAVIGNVAALDVLAARVYVRPLVSTEIPILNNLQVGVTAAVDTQPYLNTISAPATANPIAVLGADAQLPLVYVKDVVSLVSFLDVALQNGKSFGSMVGVGGKLINIFTYGAQIRLLNDNFIPDYFGPTYDLLRDAQYDFAQLTPTALNAGWQGSLGTSFFDDKIVFNVSVDGLFVQTTDVLSKPHLRGILSLAEGIVPGITFDFSYDKKGLQTFADLVDATNAAIQAQLNFKSGPAVISFVYKIVYDPANSPQWNVTSGLQSTISLF